MATMPTFIDRHLLTAVPRATQRQIHSEAVHGLIDSSGTRPLANWIDDRLIYCILVAPDRDAVCQHHIARGLACDDLQPVPELREIRPTSEEDQAIVRSTIDALWHGQEPRATHDA
jgi:hypothetical protein